MFKYKYVRNGKNSVHVRCYSPGYPFFVYAASGRDLKRIVVKSFEGFHIQSAAKTVQGLVVLAGVEGLHCLCKLWKGKLRRP